MNHRIKIQTLGTSKLKLSFPSGAVVEIVEKKNSGLLGYICANSSLGISRERARSLLWSQRSDDQGKASLRTALSNLRKRLDEHDPSLLLINRDTIQLDIDRVDIDIVYLESCLNSDKAEATFDLIEVYPGDYLEGLYINDPEFDEWIGIIRQKYHNLYRKLLKQKLEGYVADNHSAGVLDVSSRMLNLNSTDEFAHRALMRQFALEGNVSEAQTQYERCSEALSRHLDAEPSVDTTQLLKTIRTSKSKNAFTIKCSEPESETTNQLKAGLSIAVLPFMESNGDLLPGNRDISLLTSTALSKYKWLDVASKRSVISKTSELGEPYQIGKALNSRYVLDGSVSLDVDHLMIAIELIDIESNNVIRIDNYELDPHASADDINLLIGKIANQTDVQIRTCEINKVVARGVNENSAYECLIHGISNMYETSFTDFHDAKRSFERAIFLAPGYPIIYTWKILWEIFCYGQGWSENKVEQRSRLEQYVREVKQKDQEDGLSWAMCGHLESFMNHDFQKAKDNYDRSLNLNPYIAFSWMLSSATYAYSGEPKEALQRLTYAEKIRPHEPHFEFMYNSARCIAHTYAEEYERAFEFGSKTTRENPQFTNGYKQAIVPAVYAGKLDEAKALADQLLELDPAFSLSSYADDYPFGKDEDRLRFVKALRKAGIPEESSSGKNVIAPFKKRTLRTQGYV